MSDAIEPLCGGRVLAFGAVPTCRCGLPPHPAEQPHECEDRLNCGGSWRGDGETPGAAFQVVRLPLSFMIPLVEQSIQGITDR